MVNTCVVCKWRGDKKPQRSFHRFPTDECKRRLWVDILTKNNNLIVIGTRPVICSRHFEKNCFRYGLVYGRQLLKEDSLPSLYLTKKTENTRNESSANEQPTNCPSPDMTLQKETRYEHLTEQSNCNRPTDNILQEKRSSPTGIDFNDEVCKSLTQPYKPLAQACKPLAQVCKPFPRVCKPRVQVYKPLPQACSEPLAQSCEPLAQAYKPLTQVCKPFPRSSKPRVQVYKPLPQACEPLAQTCEPLVQAREPVAQAYKPLTQVCKPFPRSSKPRVQVYKPLTQACEPSTQSREPSAQICNPLAPTIGSSYQMLRPADLIQQNIYMKSQLKEMRKRISSLKRIVRRLRSSKSVIKSRMKSVTKELKTLKRKMKVQDTKNGSLHVNNTCVGGDVISQSFRTNSENSMTTIQDDSSQETNSSLEDSVINHSFEHAIIKCEQIESDLSDITEQFEEKEGDTSNIARKCENTKLCANDSTVSELDSVLQTKENVEDCEVDKKDCKPHTVWITDKNIDLLSNVAMDTKCEPDIDDSFENEINIKQENDIFDTTLASPFIENGNACQQE